MRSLYFTFFMLLFQWGTSQEAIKGVNKLEGDIMISYKITYDTPPSDKMKESPNYFEEQIIHFNKRKAIYRKIYLNPRYKDQFVLYELKKRRQFQCMHYRSGSKLAIYSDIPQPKTIAKKLEGDIKMIAGYECQKYQYKDKAGHSKTFYATSGLGIDFPSPQEFEGIKLEYSINHKTLGPATVTATKIEYVTLSASSYDIRDFTWISKEEYTNQSKNRKEEYAEKRENFKFEMVGKQLLPFRMIAQDGQKLNYKEMRGKVVVLNFFFSSCPPCVEEVPDLNELKKKYENRDVFFVAVTFDENYEIDQFIRKTGFNYNIAGDQRSYIDELGIVSYPTNIVVGRDGTIQYASTEAKPDIVETLSFAIDKELAKKLALSTEMKSNGKGKKEK